MFIVRCHSKYDALFTLPKKSFSTGIMLFKNSIIIKDLFNKILIHIIKWINDVLFQVITVFQDC